MNLCILVVLKNGSIPEDNKNNKMVHTPTNGKSKILLFIIIFIKIGLWSMSGTISIKNKYFR